MTNKTQQSIFVPLASPPPHGQLPLQAPTRITPGPQAIAARERDAPSSGKAGQRFAEAHNSGPKPKAWDRVAATKALAHAGQEFRRIALSGTGLTPEYFAHTAHLLTETTRAVTSHPDLATRAIALLAPIENSVYQVTGGWVESRSFMRKERVVVQQKFSQLLTALKQRCPGDPSLAETQRDFEADVVRDRARWLQEKVDRDFRIVGLRNLTTVVRDFRKSDGADVSELLRQEAERFAQAHGDRVLAESLRDLAPALADAGKTAKWCKAAKTMLSLLTVAPEERAAFHALLATVQKKPHAHARK
jgi:hypothetical protein